MSQQHSIPQTAHKGPRKLRIKRMFAENVLVLMDWKRDEREDQVSAGGIVLPHTGRKPNQVQAVWATVVSAGEGHHDGRTFLPMDPGIKPGARVLVAMAQSGDEFELDGLEHRIVRQSNLLAVEEA